MIKDPELERLIEELEKSADMPLADFEGVLNALTFVLPDRVPANMRPVRLATTDGALLDAELLAQVYVELMGGRQIGLELAADLQSDCEVEGGRSRPTLRRDRW